jgi:RNA polymerase sigma-70 factor (ECF subfamily)
VKDSEQINLVDAALNGDADSFGRLSERYYPALVGIAYSHLCDRNLADDVVQESLLVAFCNISKLKKPQQFVRWLAAICRNKAIDAAKKRAKERRVGVEDCKSILDGKSGDDERIEIVRNVISRLAAKMREVVYLRYYNQMSYDEIADMLGISRQAVSGRLKRAKKKIAKQLLRRASVEVRL